MAACTNSIRGDTPSFHYPRVDWLHALLERDIVRAIGELILDKPRWWESLKLSEKFKEMLNEVATQSTESICRDAAANVLDWMTPVVRKTLAARRERSLSSLVDFWPVELRGSPIVCASELRDVLPREAMAKSDRYFIFAWIMLRQICLSNAHPWPGLWGEASCSCLSMRPLVDAVVDAMMECLRRVRNLVGHQRADQIDEIARMAAIKTDGVASQSLQFFTTLQMPSILADVEGIEKFSQRYLDAIISRDCLEEVDATVSPAPLDTSLIRDGVQAGLVQDRFNESEVLVEFQLDEDSSITKTTLFQPDGDPSIELNRSDLAQTFEAIIPVFEKTLSGVANGPNSPLLRVPRSQGSLGWITIPTRPIVETPVEPLPSHAISLAGHRLQALVRVDNFVSDCDWRENDWTTHGRPSVGAATALLFVEVENVTTPSVVVKVPPLFHGEWTYQDTSIYGDPNIAYLQGYRESRCSTRRRMCPGTRDVPVGLYSRLLSALSKSVSNEAEITAISGLLHRTIVLPAFAKYCIKFKPIDPSRSSKCTVLIVSLRNPYRYAKPHQLMRKLSSVPIDHGSSC